MYVTTQTIITAAAVLGAIGSFLAVFWRFVQFVEKQKAQDVEICEIKEEQRIMCYGLLAALDGLKQLGANGNVTDAHQKLEKHLNQSAHEK